MLVALDRNRPEDTIGVDVENAAEKYFVSIKYATCFFLNVIKE